ncbi:hypothetical protein F7725_000744, partial [Dissostichus mawsoni]
MVLQWDCVKTRDGNQSEAIPAHDLSAQLGHLDLMSDCEEWLYLSGDPGAGGARSLLLLLKEAPLPGHLVQQEQSPLGDERGSGRETASVLEARRGLSESGGSWDLCTRWRRNLYRVRWRQSCSTRNTGGNALLCSSSMSPSSSTLASPPQSPTSFCLLSVSTCLILLLSSRVRSISTKFEVGPEVHGDFVLRAQQRAKDGVSRHPNTTKTRSLEFPPEVQNLEVQVFDLNQGQIIE